MGEFVNRTKKRNCFLPNRRRRKCPAISAAIWLFIVFAAAFHLGAASVSAGRDPALFISPEYAGMHTAGRANMLLVDVRSGKGFETLRIPGSISIPLHFVKSKNHLKQKRIVLVGRGFSNRRLLQACRKLNDQGFDARVLRGGLNAWVQSGLSYEGGAFAAKALSRILPREALREGTGPDVLPVDISEVVSPGRAAPASWSVFENAVHSGATGKDFADFLARYKTDRPVRPLLFFNQDGTGYESVRRQVAFAGIQNAFFLEGGLDACKSYISGRQRAETPKSERTLSINRISCINCSE